MIICEPIITLRVAIQQALIGEVTAKLKSVTCGLKDQAIEVKAYIDGEVTERDIDWIQMIGTEIIAHFPDGYSIHELCVSLEDEEEQVLDFWAFARAHGQTQG